MHPNTRNIIILFWLCVFLIALFYRGANITFDDKNYITYAQQIITGTFSIQQSPYAYGFLLPLTLALSYKLLGITTLAASLPAMIEYIIIILSTYLVLAKFYESKTALLTASFAAASPFIVLYSARVLPDMLIGAFVSVAFLYYFTKEKDSWNTFATGFLAGLTIWAKLGGFAFTSLILFLFTLRDRAHYKAFLLGVALPILTYLLIMATNTGGFNFISQYSAEQVKLSQATLNTNIGVLITFIAGYNPLAQNFAQTYPLGLLFILAIIGSYLAIKDHNKDLVICYAIVFLSLLYLLFGTESLSHYVNIAVVARYMIFLTLPMAMLAGYSISAGYNIIKTRYSERIALYFLIGLIALFLLSNAPIYWWQITHNVVYGGTPTSTPSV